MRGGRSPRTSKNTRLFFFFPHSNGLQSNRKTIILRSAHRPAHFHQSPSPLIAAPIHLLWIARIFLLRKEAKIFGDASSLLPINSRGYGARCPWQFTLSVAKKKTNSAKNVQDDVNIAVPVGQVPNDVGLMVLLKESEMELARVDVSDVPISPALMKIADLPHGKPSI